MEEEKRQCKVESLRGSSFLAGEDEKLYVYYTKELGGWLVN